MKRKNTDKDTRTAHLQPKKDLVKKDQETVMVFCFRCFIDHYSRRGGTRHGLPFIASPANVGSSSTSNRQCPSSNAYRQRSNTTYRFPSPPPRETPAPDPPGSWSPILIQPTTSTTPAVSIDMYTPQQLSNRNMRSYRQIRYSNCPLSPFCCFLTSGEPLRPSLRLGITAEKVLLPNPALIS